MNRMKRVTVFLALSIAFLSCEREGIDFDFNSPQDIQKVNLTLLNNNDLIEHFGESNIHFGPVPPNLEGISFKVTGMNYDYCERYVFGPTPDAPPIPSHVDPPTYEPSINHHHFFDHLQSISKHRMMTFGTHGDIYTKENDTIYVIGNNNNFTAYYIEKTTGEGSGNPTNAILISGTLVYDKDGKFIGVEKYRIGKKILEFEYHPTIPTYAQGTIEIKRHDELSPRFEWDTIQQPNGTAKQ